MITNPMARPTQTVHPSCIKISTISKWTGLSLEPCHLRVPSGAPKWFLHWWYVWHKLCTYLAPTITLSPNGKKWDSTWPTSHRSSIGCVQNDFWAYGTFDANCALSCVKISTMPKKDQNERYHQASKMISRPMVRLAQTMLLSCTDTNTVSKRKEARFHMSHVTEEFHQVSPKWFFSLWYVRCKPWTYLASRLALSPNGPSFHLSLIT
jgi:predicted DCC family thiol-disulfide oxidoreductase YuxK